MGDTYRRKTDLRFRVMPLEEDDMSHQLGLDLPTATTCNHTNPRDNDPSETILVTGAAQALTHLRRERQLNLQHPVPNLQATPIWKT
jgi:hypothetical protein